MELVSLDTNGEMATVNTVSSYLEINAVEEATEAVGKSDWINVGYLELCKLYGNEIGIYFKFNY